jgi:hypothetical protein
MSLPEPDSSDQSPELSATGAVSGIAILLAFGNLLFLPILSGGPGPGSGYGIAIMAALWMGALTGQFGLVAMWGVLAPQPLLVRIGSASALGAVLTLGFVVGCALAAQAHGPPPEEAFAALFGAMLLLPVTVASAQVPLWIARLCLGWQVSHIRRLDRLSRPTQFSLANLMTATALIAGLLALNQPASWLLQAPPQELWLQVGLSSLSAMLLSALTTLPATYALLRHNNLGQGFVAMMVYGFVVFAGFSLVLMMIAHSIPPEGAAVLAVIFSYIAGLALTVTLPLVVLRNYGYRLVTGNPSPEQAVKFFAEERWMQEPPK